jgi:ankyrin repeat protein
MQIISNFIHFEQETSFLDLVNLALKSEEKLLLCISDNRFFLFQKLLSEGANINCDRSILKMIFEKVHHNRFENKWIGLLVQYIDDINSTDNDRKTILDYFSKNCCKHCDKIIKYLVAHGSIQSKKD